MTNPVDRFHAALTVLAGHGHIKQRLIRAFEQNLLELHDEELPISAKQAFADLCHQMNSVAPANGEGPICASVRKMSVDEASDCANTILDLYRHLVRAGGDTQGSLALADAEETRVPPFLVKSV